MSEIDAKRAKVLRQVQALLAQAASTGFTAEAETFRAKADALMATYMIEDQELRMARPVGERSKPGSRRVNLVGRNSPIKHEIGDLASTIAKHCGIKLVYIGWNSPAKNYGLDIIAYGFEGDLDYFEMLLASITAHLLSDMEPRPAKDLPDFEKVEMVRAAGIPWPRLFELCGWSKTEGNKVMMAYRAEHKENRFVQPATYQKSFVRGFRNEVSRRLRDLVAAREVAAPGTALVLFDRSKEVEEALKEAHPKLGVARASNSRHIEAASRRGRESGSRADIGQSRFGTSSLGSLLP